MATSTVEDYLKAILLEEQRHPDVLVTTGRVAGALDVTPGTATSMMKTLADSNLVSYEPYSGVRLTEAGRQLAVHVLRRHRLVELFLVQVVGMDWSEVHEEAERLEHVVSERLLERLDEMLGHPSVDPHGDPIPDPGAVERGELEVVPLDSLVTCPVDERLRVARVADQEPTFLRLVDQRGLKPGSLLVVERRDPAADLIELRLLAEVGDAGTDGRGDPGERLSLGLRAAGKILVEPAEESGAPEGRSRGMQGRGHKI